MALASQTGLFARNPGADAPVAEKAPAEVVVAVAPESSEPAVAPAPVVAPAPPADPAPAAQAEIARLTRLLAEREAAYAKALATLENKDSENSRLTAVLAERDAELTRLRTELDSLRVEAALAAKAAAAAPVPVPVPEPTPAAELAVTPSALTSAEPAPSIPSTMAPVEERPGRLTSVHFDPSSARLSPGGQAHAAAAAVMLSEMKPARIRVIGYTDSTGRPARNRALAEARARAVADFLIRAGLPADVIEIDAMGEEGAPVPTGDGVTEPLNRCAEIIAVPL